MVNGAKFDIKFTLINSFSDVVSPELLSLTACYGITVDNFMSLSCDSESVIVLRDVRAMAKKLSTGCPQAETTTVTPDESCCRYIFLLSLHCIKTRLTLDQLGAAIEPSIILVYHFQLLETPCSVLLPNRYILHWP